MTTMTGPQLTAQALVMYVDGGKEATDRLDELQEADELALEQEQEERETERGWAQGIPDRMAVPEGMSLMESSLGVIPDAG